MLGDSKQTLQFEHQQPGNGNLFILSGSNSNFASPHKPVKKKMETKLILYLLNIGYGYVWLLNIENVKGWVLFGIGATYGIARVAFYISEKNQKRRLTELDIQERRQKIANITNIT